MFLDPGISNCNMKFVKIKIDATDPRNLNPIPHFQDEEQIKTHLLPFNSELYDALIDLCKEHKFVLDARLGSLALGMKILQ
jgi:ADP-ribose pyrophosphatase